MTRSDPGAERPSICNDCPLMARRSFLRDATLAVAGIVAAVGGAPARANALNIRLGGALKNAGDEHTYAIPAEDGATIDRENEIILVRYQGKAYGFNLSCPHQHTALRWQPEDAQFQCPRHHSRYRPDGVYVSGRATRSMDRFGIKREGANVVVDAAKYYRQDQNQAEWDSAFVGV